MLEANRRAAAKFGLDTDYIDRKADTWKHIEPLEDDLTFISVREEETTKSASQRTQI